jgi:phosphatidylinositol glycan class A protein
MEMGHKVIVVTGARNFRKGVRYLSNGLKVYYLPSGKMLNDQIVIPTLFFLFPLLRKILIRERIDLIHCHQV